MTKTLSRLPKPKQIRVRIVKERTEGTGGFLQLRRMTLQNEYSQATRSKPYAYDLVERNAIDAVAIVIERRVRGDSFICLRTALRPPLIKRTGYAIPIRESKATPVQWEVPAGLVEKSERGVKGLRACAARETEEEVGYVLPGSRFKELGHGVTLSPGVIGEKIYFLHAELGRDVLRAPGGDGSAVEENAEVVFVSLAEALTAVNDGRIADVKTEIAIRRLVALRTRATKRKARR